MRLSIPMTDEEAKYLIDLINADLMAIEENISVCIMNFGDAPTGFYEELVTVRKLKERIEDATWSI